MSECANVYATMTSVAAYCSSVFVIFKVLFSCVFVVFGARLHRTRIQFIVWCSRGKFNKVVHCPNRKSCFFSPFNSCGCVLLVHSIVFDECEFRLSACVDNLPAINSV